MEINTQAPHIIESLRKGLPPRYGVNLYSVGNEKLIDGITRYHINNIDNAGIIRFISGSWGSGKTHFFRQLRDIAFNNQCLVSNVELSNDTAPLNKFEKVFYSIISNITTPSHQIDSDNPDVAPFGNVLNETLRYLATGNRQISEAITHEQFAHATDSLMADHGIDIDFRKIIHEYWKTHQIEGSELTKIEQLRGEILQWFAGEGTIGSYRKCYNISKIVTKDNAKLMLKSLAGFVRLAGYKGLLVLFDEAETSYSVMRKSALRDAHNNLLSLINNIESLNGLFLIYATTPDFYTDEKHGIVIYGALSSRIGKPSDKIPRALDAIWNFDVLEHNIDSYQQVASKIRSIYQDAYPGCESVLPDSMQLNQFVDTLCDNHPPHAPMQFWRVLVKGVVEHFDDHMEGEVRPTDQVYNDVMDRLREE